VEASKYKKGIFFGFMPGQKDRWCSFSMNQYHETCARNRNGFDKVWIYSWDKDKIDNDCEFVSTQPARTLSYGYNRSLHEPERQPHTHMPDEVTKYTIKIKTTHSGDIVLVDDNFDY
jgi:hypothetical protein